MSTIATLLLAFLAVVVLVNLARGSFRAWLAAKFLNRVPAGSAP